MGPVGGLVVIQLNAYEKSLGFVSRDLPDCAEYGYVPMILAN